MLIRHLYYTVYMLFVATRNISENNAPLLNDQQGRALANTNTKTAVPEVVRFLILEKPFFLFLVYSQFASILLESRNKN